MSIRFFSSQPAWWTRAQSLGWVQGDAPEASADEDPNVFVVVLALLGALVCTGLAGGFLFTLFDSNFWFENPASYVVTALGIVGAGVMLQRVRGVFATCFALVLWGVFITLFVAHLLSDLPHERMALLVPSALVAAVQLVGAQFARALWVKRIMGFVFAIALYLFVNACVADSLLLMLLNITGVLMAGVWWLWIRKEPALLSQVAQRPALIGRAAFVDSAIVGLCLVLVWGSTGDMWSELSMALFGSLGTDVSDVGEQRIRLYFRVARGWAVLLSLLATVLLYRRWKQVDTATSQSLLTVLWVGALLAVATWFAPSLGMLSLVAALALIGGRWRIAVLCGLACLWVLGQFYYSLAWPLAQKGLGLALLGALLLGGLYVQKMLAARKAALDAGAPPDGFAPVAAWSRARLVCLIAGAVLIFGLVNWDVRGKEQVIAHGQPVFVQLAPVDPRSLMQGDYMALNFTLPPELFKSLENKSTPTVKVIARLDDKGRATVQRLAQDGVAAGQGEIILPLKRLKGRWTLVTDAYFFPEGTGGAFTQAKFGDFRVLPDGRALLVGLADADGNPIAVPKSLPEEERQSRRKEESTTVDEAAVAPSVDDPEQAASDSAASAEPPKE